MLLKICVEKNLLYQLLEVIDSIELIFEYKYLCEYEPKLNLFGFCVRAYKD